jgi:hypothetical protein
MQNSHPSLKMAFGLPIAEYFIALDPEMHSQAQLIIR